MLTISVDHDGITPVLNLAIERMDDMSEPLTAILADALFSAQEQIVEGKGGAFGGGGWAPMAASTIKMGRDPATLLVDSGMLVLSLSRGGEGNVFDVGPTEGQAGTNLTSQRSGYGYAAGQQRGAPNRPPRPFLAWYPERMVDYDAMIFDWITGEAAGNG